MVHSRMKLQAKASSPEIHLLFNFQETHSIAHNKLQNVSLNMNIYYLNRPSIPIKNPLQKPNPTLSAALRPTILIKYCQDSSGHCPYKRLCRSHWHLLHQGPVTQGKHCRDRETAPSPGADPAKFDRRLVPHPIDAGKHP